MFFLVTRRERFCHGDKAGIVFLTNILIELIKRNFADFECMFFIDWIIIITVI